MILKVQYNNYLLLKIAILNSQFTLLLYLLYLNFITYS